MKKFLSTLSSTLQEGVRGGLLFLALLATTTLWAYDFQSGDLYYNITSSSAPYTVEVTYLEAYSSKNYLGLTTATIPKTVTYNGTTYCVTSIGDYAFLHCHSLTSITIPTNVTSIGEAAFNGCSSLTSITIPNSVTSIGNNAFRYCSSLTSMVIESGNTTYDSRNNCNALIETATNRLIAGCQNTIIPNSVTSIGDYAFSSCSSLTSITIPNSVTSIGNSAFERCSSLTSITIPNSVTSIGNSAFGGCSSLTSVTIPNSVTSIGNGVFSDCSSLTSMVVEEGNTTYDSRDNCNAIIETATNTLISGCQNTIIPNSVTSIGDDAFLHCHSLTSITIPTNVTSIGDDAFEYCSSLTSITIPNSVTSIGDYAFYGCKALTSITIPNSVTSIGDYAFEYCSSLTSITIPNSVTSIGYRAFYGCSSLTSITIPNSVTSIGDNAFSGCSSLTSITIPNSVTNIGSSAFLSTGIYNDESNWEDGVLYICNCLIDAKTDISGSYTIREDTRILANYAFSSCSSLTSITIPNSVTSIGESAFYRCNSLASITWNVKKWENTTTQSPFSSSRKTIKSFTFGENVEHIPAYICYNMTNLTDISIGQNVSSIGKYAFYGVPWEPEGDNGVIYIGKVLFKYKGTMPSNTSIIVRDNTTQIYEKAFLNCTGLTSITIPESVKILDNSAFSGCSSLTSVAWNIKRWENTISTSPFSSSEKKIASFTFGENVEHIPAYICYNMTNLTNISIGQKVSSIGKYAFYGVPWEPKGDDGVIYIGDVLFKYKGTMPANTSITVKDNTTQIHENAFLNCTGLTSITIPETVTTIGESAFDGCSSLTSINLPKGIKSIDYCTFYGCSALNSITLPDSLITIGRSAFNSCSALESITIPSTVKEIDTYAFRSCSNLKNFIMPNSVDNIGNAVFYGCINLESIVLSENTSALTPLIADDIIYGFFEGCSSLTNIILPEKLRTIGEGTFSGCSSLASIKIPENVTTIGTYAFYECSSLDSIQWNAKQCRNWESYDQAPFYSIASQITSFEFGENVLVIPLGICDNMNNLSSMTIPSSVKTIEESAFYGCSGLSKINIPNNVTTIEARAFQGCNSVDSLWIGDGIISIPHHTFCNCYSLDFADLNKVESIGEYAFQSSGLKEITIPNSVTKIDKMAFYNCSSLTSVTIPNNAMNLGSDVWKGCSLSSITLTAPNVANFCNGNTNNRLRELNVLCTRKLQINGLETKTIKIPEGVTKLKEYAFYNCLDLNEVSLPYSLQTISENAFAGCTKLYDVYCYGMEPPMAEQSSFANYNAFLHVPCDNQRVYLLDVVFGNFKYVDCIEAETTPTDTVVVTPSFNDAEFIWPSNSSADSYTLAISKDGEVFCTLTFNANGQLTGIAFAPSRSGQHHTPAAAQLANGFAFTVTGLDEGANYTYDLLIQDRSGNTLQSYSGKFRTQSTNDRTVTVEYDATQGQVTGAGTYLVGDTVTLTAIPNDGYRFVRWTNEVEDNPYTFVISDNVTLSAEFEAVILSSLENTNSQSPMSHYQKIIRDGQLLILRDGKTYNVMGAEIQ